MKITIFCPMCEHKYVVEYSTNPVAPKQENFKCVCGTDIDLYEFIGAVQHKLEEECVQSKNSI